MNRFEESLAPFLIKPMPQDNVREYREFANRLDEVVEDGILDLNAFMHATQSEGQGRISLCTFDRTLQNLQSDAVLDRKSVV